MYVYQIILNMTNEVTEYDYDYLVIGGGSGGIASAKRAASLYGAKVAGESITTGVILASLSFILPILIFSSNALNILQ